MYDAQAPMRGLAEQNDYAAVLAVRAGVPEALDQLLLPCLGWALRLARRLTTSQADAEDLVQDACLRAIERLELFREGMRFGPWFARLLYNLAFNRQQSARVRAVEPLQEELAAGDATPLQELMAAEVRERFAGAVDRLPARQKVIVIMFEVDGFTSAEIAAELGITTETVRWHLFAARKVLRSQLRPLHLDDEEA
ncbi:MAG: sigma-70 family RNA polymerase sigma factor [Gemmatimonadetes bacterium]|nr:sigma-70 family RNA polymerase sigma factor [Gemmatimonadota bacterium]